MRELGGVPSTSSGRTDGARYETPENLVEILGDIVAMAAETRLFAQRLAGRTGVTTLDDFAALPVTPLEEYRRRRLADLVARPDEVDSIVGPYRGHSPRFVAVAESSDEGSERFNILTDAVQECISLDVPRTCAVVANAEKRYFAAEVATILIRSGVSAHVFVDRGGTRKYEQLRLTKPEIVVALSGPIEESELPSSVKLCVTFRGSERLLRVPQLDLYVVSELGFLGHSTDGDRYVLNKDSYYFERSNDGYLIVTSLFNVVQPLLRIVTSDEVGTLEQEFARFGRLPPGM